MNFCRCIVVLCLLLFGRVAIAETPEVIKVGVILPLTGPLAHYGVATQNGMILAMEESPQLFKRVVFKFEDSAYDSKLALQAYHKLQAVDRVDLTMVWGTGPSQVLVPVAEAKRTPTIVITTETGVTDGAKNVLRFYFEAEHYTKPLILYLRSKGYKRLGLVKTDIAFFEEMLEGMRKNLASDESIEILDSFPPSANDFRSSFVKLKGKDYQALGAFITTGQVSSFFKQAKNLGVGIPIFGTNMFESSTELANSQGTMIGAVYPTLGVASGFRTNYLHRYGDDVQVSFAALAYDFSMMVGGFSSKAEISTGSELLAAFRSKTPYSGAVGKLSYVEPKEGVSYYDIPVVVRRVAKDGFVAAGN